MFKNEVLEFLGISEWHRQGITGKGINFLEMEGDCGHEDVVEKHIRAAAPGIRYLNKSFGSKIKGGKLVGGEFLKLPKYCKENNIHILGASIGGNSYKDTINILKQVESQGIILVASAGNNEGRLTGYSKGEVFISTGALTFKKNVSKITKKRYSSTGKELDFTIPTISNSEGTSFTAPVLSGMCALVLELCFKRYGCYLNNEQIYQFLKDNCYDLGEKGHDYIFGHGIPILPNPKDINFDKYIKGEGENMSKIIRDLDRLHPYVKELAEKMLNKCKEAGIQIVITETFRTKKRQQELYNQGRTTSGNIVTNAKPGNSMHNYSLAFDIVPVEKGKALWHRRDLFDRVGQIGMDLGLTWGGSWKSFKDYPHFQWTGGLTLTDLKAGKMPEVPQSEVSEWAKTAWYKAVRKGINDGIGPKNAITEEQLMVFLDRLGLLD